MSRKSLPLFGKKRVCCKEARQHVLELRSPACGLLYPTKFQIQGSCPCFFSSVMPRRSRECLALYRSPRIGRLASIRSKLFTSFHAWFGTIQSPACGEGPLRGGPSPPSPHKCTPDKRRLMIGWILRHLYHNRVPFRFPMLLVIVTR